MEAVDPDRVLREQRAYYDARAAEYDEAYRREGQHDRGDEGNESWRDEMQRLRSAFDAVPLEGDIVELAAGTGAWTKRLVGRAGSLTVLDGSADMLDRNRARVGTGYSITYEVVDLFEWRPPRTWDACVFGFWLCKVPDARVDGFLGAVAAALRPGGVVCCVDKVTVAEPLSELEDRTLNDGRRFTIIDHPRPPRRITELFRSAGMNVDVRTFGSRFCLASGTKAAQGC
jgi:demethylmenaquinone methyltransferase/2-methoxy-6-polyprenyl-1,4-benzoquinol methylase